MGASESDAEADLKQCVHVHNLQVQYRPMYNSCDTSKPSKVIQNQHIPRNSLKYILMG